MAHNSYVWYEQLKRPSWAPPSWVFGPVWTFLYILILLSYGFVGYQYFIGILSFAVVLPFVLNIFFNFLFTPLQFGLRSNVLAAIDIILTLGTLGWALYRIFPIISWVAYANIPYFLWVCFATALQLTVTKMNLKRS